LFLPGQRLKVGIGIVFSHGCGDVCLSTIMYIQTPKTFVMKRSLLTSCSLLLIFSILFSCNGKDHTASLDVQLGSDKKADTLEYFNLRPKLEKEYGYTHAVRIGDDLKISGAVSMNDSGIIVGAGNMELQMKNCYSDLEKILQHYGYSFDDVVVENVYTTNMADFIKAAGFRSSIYKKQFPTGTWLEVKGLAVPGQLIEIDMEAHKVR
jgi:2-iminobutanoate/2-iminopropanoate deaminase